MKHLQSRDQPLVSVNMAAFNSERFISAAIESVIRQDYSNIELIVVDDGSEDSTPSIVEEYAKSDSRIKLFCNEVNTGIGHARNRCLSNSNGRYILVLDSDDVSTRNRIINQVNYLETHPNVDVVCGSALIINEDEKKIGQWRFKKDQLNVDAKLLFYNQIVHSTVMMRATPDLKYRPDLSPCEDYDLWARMTGRSCIQVLGDFYVIYRHHSDSSSRVKPEITEQKTREILSSQLRNLGLEIKDQKMDLHRMLGNQNYMALGQKIEKARDWLELLKIRNNQTQFLNVPIFNSFLYLQWLKIKLNCKTKIKSKVLEEGFNLNLLIRFREYLKAKYHSH